MATDNMYSWDVFIDTLVSGATVEVGSNLPLSSLQKEHFGLWYKATSDAGTPKIKIYYKMSKDNVAANYVIPEDVEDIDAILNDENAHVASFGPPTMKFLQIFASGLASNPDDTVLNATLVAV